MKRGDRFSRKEWDQVINHIQLMSPIELKKLHIQQCRAAQRDIPELAEQIQPILDKLRTELRTLKLEAVK